MLFDFQSSGGLSNYLYCCSLPDDIETQNNEPRKILLRYFLIIIFIYSIRNLFKEFMVKYIDNIVVPYLSIVLYVHYYPKEN
jgi:hypothetical protein